MRNILLLLFFITSLNCNTLQAQENTINKRFKGKEKKLIEFLQKNLTYPSSSFKNKSIGYSIASITITPNGVIEDVSIINPLDKDLDNEVIRVLKITENKWKKEESLNENQVFYIQIVFSIVHLTESAEIINPVNKKYNFLEPVVSTAMVFKRELLPESDESIAIKCNELLKKENYEKALIHINELIQRNPFNKELYQLRMSICKRLDKTELIMKDTNKISNFISGVPLDKIIAFN